MKLEVSSRLHERCMYRFPNRYTMKIHSQELSSTSITPLNPVYGSVAYWRVQKATSDQVMLRGPVPLSVV